jgi:hypothetical protein
MLEVPLELDQFIQVAFLGIIRRLLSSEGWVGIRAKHETPFNILS